MGIAGKSIEAQVRLGRDPNDCWEWVGPVGEKGYGKKQVNGRCISAAKWLWEQLFGPLPSGAVVAHACGNKGCVNPHHLRAGDQADANRAGIAATLTPGDVFEIRAVPIDQRDAAVKRAFAERFGVSPNIIRDVWAGRAWGRAYQRRIRNQAESARRARTAQLDSGARA